MFDRFRLTARGPRNEPPLTSPALVALLLVSFLLLDALVSLPMTSLWLAYEGNPNSPNLGSLVLLISRVVLVAFIAFMAWRDAISPTSLGLGSAPWGAIFPVFVALFALVFLAQLSEELLPYQVEDRLQALTQDQAAATAGVGAQIFRALLLIALVPFVEELLFRGVLQPLVIKQIGLWLGLFAQAFIFAAMHVQVWALPPAGTLSALVALGILGLFAGVLTRYYRSIWPAVALHALNNALVFLFVVFVPRLI